MLTLSFYCKLHDDGAAAMHQPSHHKQTTVLLFCCQSSSTSTKTLAVYKKVVIGALKQSEWAWPGDYNNYDKVSSSTSTRSSLAKPNHIKRARRNVSTHGITHSRSIPTCFSILIIIKNPRQSSSSSKCFEKIKHFTII